MIRRRIIRDFFVSVAAVLFVTAAAKFYSATGSANILSLKDPINRAVEVDPLSARAHSVLAGNLMAVHQYDLALVHAKESLRLEPRSVESLSLLGDLSSAVGNSAGAQRYYKKALVLNPNHRQALFGFARLLSTTQNPKIRNGTVAVRVAERLCNRTGDRYPRYLGMLGHAYAAAGRFKEAIAETEKALSLARRIRDVECVANLSEQLSSFQGGKAVFVAPKNGAEL